MATTLKGTIWGGVVFSASPATISIPTGYLVNEDDLYYVKLLKPLQFLMVYMLLK